MAAINTRKYQLKDDKESFRDLLMANTSRYDFYLLYMFSDWYAVFRRKGIKIIPVYPVLASGELEGGQVPFLNPP